MKKHARRWPRGAAGIALAGLASFLVGCGVKAPEIAAVEWRLESRPSDSGPDYESLSVFCVLKDEEGLDNVVELWVVNDETALAWKLTSLDWIRVAEGADNWIGGSALARPDFAPLARGPYRIIAIDAAGERAEREFRVTGDFPQRAPPTISFSAGELAIRSQWPETLALAFDGAGALIGSPSVFPGAMSPAEAFGADLAARTAEVGAYGYEPSLKIGAFSKRVKIR